MKERTFEARLENIEPATAFIEEELKALGCSAKAQTQIAVALDELLSNIVRYAYGPRRGDMTVRMEADPENRTVSITLIDSGDPFDPLKAPEPDTGLPASERQIGGLGIFLVRKTMDGLSYVREQGKNMVTIRKRI